MEISNQCKECVKLKNQQCLGKSDVKTVVKFFGSVQPISRKTGLNFCSQYEFDEVLYTFKDGIIYRADTYADIKERSVEKEKETQVNDHADIADFAAGLSSEAMAQYL